MQRYFNKKLGTEVIPSIHKITADCVELPDDHFFLASTAVRKKKLISTLMACRY